MGINTSMYKSIAAFGDAAATAARQSSKAARNAAVAEKLAPVKRVATTIGLVGGSAAVGFAVPRGIDRATGWYSNPAHSDNPKLASLTLSSLAGLGGSLLAWDVLGRVPAAAVGATALAGVASLILISADSK